jgi:hypothetical protein
MKPKTCEAKAELDRIHMYMDNIRYHQTHGNRGTPDENKISKELVIENLVDTVEGLLTLTEHLIQKVDGYDNKERY